jgi:hypothetical protein
MSLSLSHILIAVVVGVAVAPFVVVIGVAAGFLCDMAVASCGSVVSEHGG